MIKNLASHKKLRIAFVVHDYNKWMGHSRYVVELAKRYRDDHDVHVFTNHVDESDKAGITFHHVPAARSNVMTTLLTFAISATWLVGRGFDVIHAQGVCGLRQNVVTAHICQGAWIDAMAKYSNRLNWKKRLFHKVAGWFERYTFSSWGTRKVIAVSQRIADDLRRYYGYSQLQHVIHHGVDGDSFHPRNREAWKSKIREEIGVDDQDLVALYVGDYQKGLDPTIRALIQVPKVHLVGVGRTPPGPYQALAKEKGMESRVHLLPPSGNIERYYAAADMLVFPSFYDPFGLVATEAMATGIAVICSAEAGASEVIEDGVDGLITRDPWNPDDLARLMNSLASDDAKRQRIGNAARCKMETMTWDKVAAETMAVYETVVSTAK